MGAVANKWSEQGYHFQKNIPNLVDNVSLFLTFVEHFCQPNVDCVDLQHVPKDLRDKVFPSGFWDDVEGSERLDPRLKNQ